MDAVNDILQLLQTPGLYQVEINEADTEVNDRRFYRKFTFQPYRAPLCSALTTHFLFLSFS